MQWARLQRIFSSCINSYPGRTLLEGILTSATTLDEFTLLQITPQNPNLSLLILLTIIWMNYNDQHFLLDSTVNFFEILSSNEDKKRWQEEFADYRDWAISRFDQCVSLKKIDPTKTSPHLLSPTIFFLATTTDNSFASFFWIISSFWWAERRGQRAIKDYSTTAPRIQICRGLLYLKSRS